MQINAGIYRIKIYFSFAGCNRDITKHRDSVNTAASFLSRKYEHIKIRSITKISDTEKP